MSETGEYPSVKRVREYAKGISDGKPRVLNPDYSRVVSDEDKPGGTGKARPKEGIPPPPGSGVGFTGSPSSRFEKPEDQGVPGVRGDVHFDDPAQAMDDLGKPGGRKA